MKPIPLSKLYFVGFSMTNTPMATAFIRESVAALHGSYDAEFGRIASSIAVNTTRGFKVFVDAFMTRYPRGKGTKGSPLLRKMYAACRTIKVEQSRRGHWRWNYGANSVTKRQQEILASFTDPLEIKTRKNGGITGASKSYEVLSDMGLLMVEYDGRFSVIEAWVTDEGIRVGNLARRSVPTLRPFMSSGSEILSLETIDGVGKHMHFAQAKDADAAERIAAALNMREG